MNQDQIQSINDLIRDTQRVDGYVCNMRRGNQHASITASNEILSNLWTTGFKFRLDPAFTFGKDQFEIWPARTPGPDRFLSNIKLSRWWNPGSTRENAFIELDAPENQLKLQVEDNNGSAVYVKYFGKGIIQKIHDGMPHRFDFIYVENSGLNKWDGTVGVYLDDVQLCSYTDVPTRFRFSGHKRPHTIGFNGKWEPGPNGDHAPNIVELWDFKCESNESYSPSVPTDGPVLTTCAVCETQYGDSLVKCPVCIEPETRICDGCQWFFGNMDCRRHAPIVNPRIGCGCQSQNRRPIWPEVSSLNTCGDWEKRRDG